jgi:hypothetical protein
MEQLFLFQKNVMKLQLQMERCFSELAGIWLVRVRVRARVGVRVRVRVRRARVSR